MTGAGRSYKELGLGVGVVVLALLGYFVLIPLGVDSPANVPIRASCFCRQQAAA